MPDYLVDQACRTALFLAAVWTLVRLVECFVGHINAARDRDLEMTLAASDAAAEDARGDDDEDELYGRR